MLFRGTKTEYLEDRRKRRWFAGGQAYIITMMALVLAMFVYEEQKARENREFIERVCAGLEEYREGSNERRKLVQSYLVEATKAREKTGPPLSDAERKQAKQLIEGFSEIPPVDDCQP